MTTGVTVGGMGLGIPVAGRVGSKGGISVDIIAVLVGNRDGPLVGTIVTDRSQAMARTVSREKRRNVFFMVLLSFLP
jgi:hypothetical protein